MEFFSDILNWFWNILKGGFNIYLWIVYIFLIITVILPIAVMTLSGPLIFIFYFFKETWFSFVGMNKWKKISLLLLIGIFIKALLVFFPSNSVDADERSQSSAKKVIRSAVAKSLKAYRKEGLSGLKKISVDCYNSMDVELVVSKLYECSSVDMLANMIDADMSKTYQFPPDEYFSIEQFQKRIGPVFIEKGFSMEKTNQAINLVEKEIKEQITLSYVE